MDQKDLDFEIDFELPEPEPVNPAMGEPTAPPVSTTPQPTTPAYAPASSSELARKLQEAESRLKELEQRAASEPDSPQVAFELMRATSEISSLRAAWETARAIEAQLVASSLPQRVDAIFAQHAQAIGRLGQRAQSWLKSRLEQDLRIAMSQDPSAVHNHALIEAMFWARYGELMANAKAAPRAAGGVPNAGAPQAPKQAPPEELPVVAQKAKVSQDSLEWAKKFDLGEEYDISDIL